MDNLHSIQTTNENVKQPLATLIDGWIISNDEAFLHHLSSYMGHWPNAKFKCASDFESRTLLNNDRDKTLPDLVIIDGKTDWIAIVNQFNNTNTTNATDIILLAENADTSLLRQALKYGIKDVLSIPFNETELDQILYDCAGKKRNTAQLGEVSVFINAKGGMGASIIATTVAHMLALEKETHSVLIDTDAQFGCIPSLLSAQPKFILSDALNQVEELDEYALDGLLTKHESGLRFISSRNDDLLDKIPTINALAFNRFLLQLRNNFDHVVVDLSRGLENSTLPALAEANNIFIVVQQNVPAISEAAHLIKQLKHLLGINENHLKIIVNRYSKSIDIDPDEIKKTLHVNELILIPNDYQSVSAATNLGELLAINHAKRPIVKGMRIATNCILNKTSDEAHGIKRLFSFLTS
ncbi:AAA family ATPase [Photobacterium lipolyticum]|uniref:Type II/IV secretion system ATPase TadZ/CpaE, associated with Flp pilus assembly n=1 Tax=Photobacterium lipolyticum TaxID=266810 RepID=A0A2T3MYX2_9GAMM|nr:AAA family ATPase [Photobacterium lipolyticum]PSW05148.1 Type II/IV secretion system ATPase TadZ/CpaE, associated with Flp pilus assembly [Photobacterium lipolyticum]